METLWTTRCAICDAPGDILCDACRAKLRFVDACKACPTCGAPYGSTQCTECNSTMMASLGRTQLPMDSMAHCIILDNDSRRIITSFKDQGEQRLAHVIAGYIARFINPDWIAEGACITFIPATKAAVRKRGFDHIQLIAGELATLTGLRVEPVFARPASLDQRKLSRRRRVENMGNTICLMPDRAVPHACILVDDICTTGSTLFAASDALKAAGCAKVYAVTFGRVLDI